MFSLFTAIADRLKALFIAHVGLDFEAQALIRDAERKADLFRLAARYEEEGLQSVAVDLRQHAEAISLQRPLASVLPAVEHLQADATPFLTSKENGTMPTNVIPKEFPPVHKKRGR